MAATLLIYGATGFTGGLIAEFACKQGLNVILAGRNADWMRMIGENMGVQTRAFSLDDPDEIDEGLAGIDVVLNAAGPFVDTAEPLLDACLRNKVHYLDICCELDILEAIAERSDEAEESGIMVLPGVGFSTALADGIAANLKRRLPNTRKVTIAISNLLPLSPGMMRSAAEIIGKPCQRRRRGELVTEPRRRLRSFDFGRGSVRCYGLAWGELSTIHRSTEIPNIEIYFQRRPEIARLVRLDPVMAWLMARNVFRSRIEQFIDEQPKAPSPDSFGKARAHMIGIAVDNRGQQAVTRLHTPDPYTVTARIALAIAARALEGEIKPGFQTPSRYLGSGMLSRVPGLGIDLEEQALTTPVRLPVKAQRKAKTPLFSFGRKKSKPKPQAETETAAAALPVPATRFAGPRDQADADPEATMAKDAGDDTRQAEDTHASFSNNAEEVSGYDTDKGADDWNGHDTGSGDAWAERSDDAQHTEWDDPSREEPARASMAAEDDNPSSDAGEGDGPDTAVPKQVRSFLRGRKGNAASRGRTDDEKPVRRPSFGLGQTAIEKEAALDADGEGEDIRSHTAPELEDQALEPELDPEFDTEPEAARPLRRKPSGDAKAAKAPFSMASLYSARRKAQGASFDMNIKFGEDERDTSQTEDTPSDSQAAPEPVEPVDRPGSSFRSELDDDSRQSAGFGFERKPFSPSREPESADLNGKEPYRDEPETDREDHADTGPDMGEGPLFGAREKDADGEDMPRRPFGKRRSLRDTLEASRRPHPNGGDTAPAPQAEEEKDKEASGDSPFMRGPGPAARPLKRISDLGFERRRPGRETMEADMPAAGTHSESAREDEEKDRSDIRPDRHSEEEEKSVFDGPDHTGSDNRADARPVGFGFPNRRFTAPQEDDSGTESGSAATEHAEHPVMEPGSEERSAAPASPEDETRPSPAQWNDTIERPGAKQSEYEMFRRTLRQSGNGAAKATWSRFSERADTDDKEADPAQSGAPDSPPAGQGDSTDTTSMKPLSGFGFLNRSKRAQPPEQSVSPAPQAEDQDAGEGEPAPAAYDAADDLDTESVVEPAGIPKRPEPAAPVPLAKILERSEPEKTHPDDDFPAERFASASDDLDPQTDDKEPGSRFIQAPARRWRETAHDASSRMSHGGNGNGHSANGYRDAEVEDDGFRADRAPKPTSFDTRYGATARGNGRHPVRENSPEEEDGPTGSDLRPRPRPGGGFERRRPFSRRP